jgi:hypothetical protein
MVEEWGVERYVLVEVPTELWPLPSFKEWLAWVVKRVKEGGLGHEKSL